MESPRSTYGPKDPKDGLVPCTISFPLDLSSHSTYHQKFMKPFMISAADSGMVYAYDSGNLGEHDSPANECGGWHR